MRNLKRTISYKQYRFLWLDKDGNEVDRTNHEYFSIKLARDDARFRLNTTLQADVVKIKVDRIYKNK